MFFDPMYFVMLLPALVIAGIAESERSADIFPDAIQRRESLKNLDVSD